MGDKEALGLSVENSSRYQTFKNLHPLHWERLAKRPEKEVVAASGAAGEGGGYRLTLLGRDIVVEAAAKSMSYPDNPEKTVGYQRALVAVSWLAGALDAPPSGKLVSPREFPGGQAFFRGPHELPSAPIAKAFQDDPGKLFGAGEKISAGKAEGADAAIEFMALPGVGAKVLVWGGDEELPGSAAILLDSRAHLHLALDVVWALTNIIAAELTREAST